jgi:hypothetical protein
LVAVASGLSCSGGVVLLAPHVFVVLWECERGLLLERDLVETGAQDRLDGLIRNRTDEERSCTGRLQTRRGETVPETQQSETGAKALLRMGPLLEMRCTISAVRGPVCSPPRIMRDGVHSRYF